MNKKDKAKPRELKPIVKRLIIQRAIAQRKVPREFLANQLIREIEESDEIPPALETAKRYISKARNSENPIDKPWSLACCSEYSEFFPPESIPFLLECLQFHKALYKVQPPEEQKIILMLNANVLTIREAIWIVRLKPLVESVFSDEISSNEDERFSYHIIAAYVYCSSELAGEVLGEDFFDSSDLDQALLSKDIKFLFKAGIGFTLLKPGKSIQCNHNCEQCRYVNIMPGYCTEVPKEGKK